MEKEIEVGDFALINNHQYPIVQILENEIIIENPDGSLSSIIKRNGIWSVETPDDKPHKVQFLKRQIPLLETSDIDIQILRYVDDQTLLSMCEVDLSPVCQKEEFWMYRILDDVGPWVIKYKPVNESYKEQYYNLKKIEKNIIKWLDIEKESFSHYVITGIDYTNFSIIDSAYNFLMNVEMKRIDWEDIDLERSDYIIAMIEYEQKHGTNLEDKYSIIRPIINIDDPQLWNAYRQYIFKNLFFLAQIATNNNFLTWILQQPEIQYGDTPHHIIALTIILENIDLLNLFYQAGWDLTPYVNYAANFEKINVLEWMRGKNITIDINLFNINPEYVIPISIYLLTHGLMTPDDLKDVLENEDAEYPLFDEYLNDDNIQSLEILKSYGVLPERRKIDQVDITKGTKILDWLDGNGLLEIPKNIAKIAEWINEKKNK